MILIFGKVAAPNYSRYLFGMGGDPGLFSEGELAGLRVKVRTGRTSANLQAFLSQILEFFS